MAVEEKIFKHFRQYYNRYWEIREQEPYCNADPWLFSFKLLPSQKLFLE
ncbi:MAG: hypothetical protein AABW85_05715 [archaeon]